jgi:hypothetical protein
MKAMAILFPTIECNVRLIGYYLINIGFLIYGVLRLLGSVPGFAHVMGWWDNKIGREIVSKIDVALPELSEKAIVVLSIEAYMGWSVLMGLVLTVGSLLALFKARIGYLLMGSYFVLFGLGFVNYLSINAKILHFAVGLSLFVVMLLLSKRLNGAGGRP